MRIGHGPSSYSSRRSCSLGRAGDVDRNGSGSRHRHPDLCFDPDQQIARASTFQRLPHRHRPGAVSPSGLLGTITFIIQLTEPLFPAFGHNFWWRDLILIAGGLFLVWIDTREIHHNVDPELDHGGSDSTTATVSLASAIGQILLLDLVFSIDSIVAAVGMTEHRAIMMIAVVVAVTVMLFAAVPEKERPGS